MLRKACMLPAAAVMSVHIHMRIHIHMWGTAALKHSPRHTNAALSLAGLLQARGGAGRNGTNSEKSNLQ
jgi:hypothetical protein